MKILSDHFHCWLWVTTIMERVALFYTCFIIYHNLVIYIREQKTLNPSLKAVKITEAGWRTEFIIWVSAPIRSVSCWWLCELYFERLHVNGAELWTLCQELTKKGGRSTHTRCLSSSLQGLSVYGTGFLASSIFPIKCSRIISTIFCSFLCLPH